MPGLRFSFLESSGVLPAAMREIVIDRAMAAPGDPVSIDDLKIIVLMVYWSFGQEPDALVLDELCDPADGASRIKCHAPKRLRHQRPGKPVALRLMHELNCSNRLGIRVQLGQRIARGAHSERFFFGRQQQAGLQIGRQAASLDQVAAAAAAPRTGAAACARCARRTGPG